MILLASFFVQGPVMDRLATLAMHTAQVLLPLLLLWVVKVDRDRPK
ncbi:MAG: hypothetical protein ACOYEV_01385 [Candidatus Nanopelagicales bacterium]